MQRSIRRAQARRLAKERRRLGLAAGAAIGATALFAPAAQATDFTVSSTNDGPAAACAAVTNCANLRDAVAAANAGGGDDTITFNSGVTGTVTLTQGEIPVTAADKLAINGPGRDSLSVSGDKNTNGLPDAGDSRIFNVTGTGAFSISGLTLTHGASLGGAVNSEGGAIVGAANSKISLTDAAVTNSKTDGPAGGGGIFANGLLTLTRTTVSGNVATTAAGGVGVPSVGNAGLTISGSTISGNSAPFAGGIQSRAGASISDSTISGNHATTTNGGGILSNGPLTVTNSTISGNDAVGRGGGIHSAGDYAEIRMSNSTVSGNSAASGGGLGVSSTKYGVLNQVTDSTISGNHSTASGAGVLVATLTDGARLQLVRSTISGNDGGAGFGGGVGLDTNSSNPIQGEFDLIDSTISGNTAAKGAGVSAGGPTEAKLLGSNGVVDFANSTIAANNATSSGGGIYLGQYDSSDPVPVKTSATLRITSTIVADNKVAGSPQDLARVATSTGGGFDLAFALVETPGSAPLIMSPGASIVGVDPQLGPLAANGGATQTQLPSNGSPVVDKGKAPARLNVDQRGHDRIVDINVPNDPRGDGADIGAIEVDHPTPIPPPDKKPTVTIKKNRLGSKNKKNRVVSGTAADDHKVAKVQVALVFKVKGRCSDLLSSGDFSAPRRCSKPPKFHGAKGKNKWTFKLSKQLDPGKYTVFARATDNAGQRSSFNSKNRKDFTVKK